MPISQIYNQKNVELTQLLTVDPVIDNLNLGRRLCDIYTQNANEIPNIFTYLGYTTVNNYIRNSEERCEEFCKEIIKLLINNDEINYEIKERLNNFLLYFRKLVIDFQHNGGKQASTDASGWYVASIFLMLYEPTQYIRILKKPRQQINDHPLVRFGINADLINGITRFDQNTNSYPNINNYLNVIENIKLNKNVNEINYIEFLDELELMTGVDPDEEDIANKNKNKNKSSNNKILYGPPGTGKTYHTINKSLEIIDPDFFDANKNSRAALKARFDALLNEQILFVTFHQSYSYEEFVEGIRAETKDGQISYTVKDGFFKSICKAAKGKPNKNYVLIIDEINRGNISKIFGELITLIEESKREGKHEALSVTLPYSNETFSVPNNLYIIGTMNTADRSLALMDTALRRRFDFIEMMPDINLLCDDNQESIIVENIDISKMLQTMNQRIEVLYDREHTLGHAFFMPLFDDRTIENLASIFKNKIIPLLQEYFFEDWDKIRMVLGDDKKISNDSKFVVEKEFVNNLFKDNSILSKSIRYEVYNDEQHDVFLNPIAYISIYQ
jgi:hypothetical protein